MDSVHVPFFAGITVLFYFSMRPEFTSRTRRILFAAIAAISWAGAVELIQPYTGRSESIIDFRNGTAGVAFAALGLAFPRGIPVIAAGVLAVYVATLQPAWLELRGIHWRTSHFPLLGDFESDDEMKVWIAPDADDNKPCNTRLNRVELHASSGTHSLEVTAVGLGYPGVRYLAERQDWRAYSAFAFDVFNPGEPFDLSLRIDDSNSTNRSDRYSAAIPLNAGWNHIRIPIAQIAGAPSARLLRLGSIERVVFFMDGNNPRTFYLDRVRLE